jgi:nitrous oxidase accessory protein
MSGAAAVLAIALAALAPLSSAADESLQNLVDSTESGGVLRLPPGTYTGGVVLRRPISIEGGGAATVDAKGSGSVIRILTSGAAVRGLRLVNSGTNHDTLDAGVQIRGTHNVVEDNVMEDCLFGVDLARSDHNTVRGNRIRSKEMDLGLRGDAIRLWYSRHNEITDNDIADVRDVVVWYSGENVIARNEVSGSRYALHFMYAERNVVEDNLYRDNMVGIFLMYMPRALRAWAWGSRRAARCSSRATPSSTAPRASTSTSPPTSRTRRTASWATPSRTTAWA